VLNIDDPVLIKTTDVLGVDFGIVNITDGGDKSYTGGAIERSAPISCAGAPAPSAAPARLPSDGCASSFRRQRRFQTHCNHVISKALVEIAHRSGRAIGVEDLTHIRTRLKARRSQRGRLHKWSFGQLRQFVAYKACRCSISIPATRAKPARAMGSRPKHLLLNLLRAFRARRFQC
jgi:IS605 OrfB family transposase